MIQKVKKLYHRLLTLEEASLANTKELEWAHIYHDSIRGKKWLEELSLSPGRWAGNYSFFYVLNRILSDHRPKRIIEFGLGESTKMISSFLSHELTDSKLLTVEHSKDWNDAFNKRFKRSERCQTLLVELQEKEYKGKHYTGYKDITAKVNEKFDLYLVDGPFGSDHYSRYDIAAITHNLNKEDQFIIIMDDCQRLGEEQTIIELESSLLNRGISVFKGKYEGNKSQIVLATEKYKYSTSL
ncbi:MAG: hypothetical protein MUF42_02445 [Cytophagaceae bacterium]|jgi:2-succinyl-5-enolpyruvyl-6-hydroxy-3-cyclohexene-1-carboxylate synthase|nr:hypothetical protein [Cytophagaceae bacterium]